MAAPSTTLLTFLHSGTSTAGMTTTAGSVSASANTRSIGSWSTASSPITFYAPFTATTNFTDRFLHVVTRCNAHLHLAQNTLFLRDSLGNQRSWDGLSMAANSSATTGRNIYLDPTLGPFVDSGAFDITQIAGIGCIISPSNSATGRAFVFSNCSYLNAKKGIILVGGESGNLASIVNLAFDESLGGFSLAKGFSEAIAAPTSISLGDGVTTSNFLINGSYVILRDNTPKAVTIGADNGNQGWLHVPALSFVIDTDPAQNLDGLLLVRDSGSASTRVYDFLDESSFANTVTLLDLRDPRNVDFGISNYSGSVTRLAGLAEGGNNINIAFINGTSPIAYEWNGTADLSGSEFIGGGHNHYINCSGANFTDGATLDISGITLGTPGTRKIRVDAAGKTLNIQSAGGFTIDDVTVVAGTVNIIAPTPTLTITGLVSGCEVRLYDLDSASPGFLGTELAGVETLTGTTFEYIHPGTTNTIWVQVIATGFEEFGQSFVLGALNQGLQVVLGPEENI